ncbi:MAG: transketolase [Desulfobulbaceae bacterium]|nr:transketolase [Desulfobulbaceae bacterium]
MQTDEQHNTLKKIEKLIRYYIITATSEAGSGHPTSSLSAVELMTALLFGGIFRYDTDHPEHPNNDRLIFSKGHASPLFYALWLLADTINEHEMMSYRQFGSSLEGHPTAFFPYNEAATGSLGQGLGIGVGMALNAKLDKLPYRTFVLLGDSEMMEGSQWESMQLAAHYRLNNLTGILDVNRLGQCGQTMYGHDIDAYVKRISAFGWKTVAINGHNLNEVLDAYETALQSENRPVMILAETVKGKGFSEIENRNGWHGKTLDDKYLKKALDEIGTVDKTMRGKITRPADLHPSLLAVSEIEPPVYKKGEMEATRDAYGKALTRIYPAYPHIVCLYAEVSNSTRAEYFKNKYPERFFEMYVAEQNMAETALGFACRGKIPFVSTFAAFMSRAYDQIRMSQYSDADIKYAGSHAGVSIGADGPSQMGLEDIAFFRTIRNGVVFYPCDAVSTHHLVEQAAYRHGIFYIRTSRGKTPVIYDAAETFPIGGCKVLQRSDHDRITVIGAGITVHESLAACDDLKKDNIFIRVVDLYCIKPIDAEKLLAAVNGTDAILTVEDHYPEGGIGEAVRSALWKHAIPVASLAVRKKPRSGSPAELLDFEEISSSAITNKIKTMVSAC